MAQNNGHQPASFLREIVALRDGQRVDPAASIPGMPPNFGHYAVRHVGTFQTFMTSIANVYRDYDEAVKHSLDNARYMRNDCGIMECLEARQRATALLNWHIEPEDDKSQDQKALCEVLTKILERIPRLAEYRLNLLHALWYGKYAIQHRYGWQTISGRRYVMPTRERENCGWLPVNGDKLVFRFDTRQLKPNQHAHQVGIRVGIGMYQPDEIKERLERANPIEATDRGMAYFLTDAERKLLAIHKHSIEDGAYEDALSAGMIHGVGIRSRIYWDWFQKQESLGFLIEYLERSAGGIELWQYPQGNPQAKAEMEEAAKSHVGGKRNVLLVPTPPGEEGLQYGVQIIEPGLAGIDIIKDLLANYYGHRIKRYILGQTLSSEAESTGLGSGVADLHMETFQQIIHYDAGNLEETITNDLLEPIKRWNFPQANGIKLRFKIDTEKTDQDQRMKAFELAWSMGARIKESDVLEVVGAAVPTPDECVLSNPQIEQAKAQTQAMQLQQQQMQQQMGMGRSQASVPADIAPNPERDAAKLAQLLGMQSPAPGPEGVTAAGGDGATTATGPEQYRRTGEPARYSYVVRDPDLRAAITRAADETEREPSDAAKAAGNYRKGKFAFHGLEIAIEVPQGAKRRGKSRLGVSWEVEMPAHYGYIRRTESDADGMHVDCFVGPTPESEIVYIVDQQTDGGRFDEHKCMLGFRTMAEARQAYLDAYSAGWKGLREITPIAMPQFKNWLEHGDTSKAFAGQVSKYARTWTEGGNIKFDWREDGPDGGAEAGGTAAPKSEPKGENCGTGAGGFQPGNTCAGDGKGRDEKPVTKDRVKVSAKNMGGRWYAMADLPDGKQVTRSDADQAKAVQLAHEDIRGAGFEPHVPEDERGAENPTCDLSQMFQREFAERGFRVRTLVQRYNADFERKHPRDEGGQFSETQGAGVSDPLQVKAHEIADRKTPLTANQIRQHAHRYGFDPNALVAAVRKLRSRKITGEELEEQRRKSAEGVAASERERRKEQARESRYALEEQRLKQAHDVLTGLGYTLRDTSESGSRYYYHDSRPPVRVSDHAPNATTEHWMDNADVVWIDTLGKGFDMQLRQLTDAQDDDPSRSAWNSMSPAEQWSSLEDRFGPEWSRERSDKSEAIYLTRGKVRVRLATHRAVRDCSSSDIEATYFPPRNSEVIDTATYKYVRRYYPGAWAVGFGEAKYTSDEVWAMIQRLVEKETSRPAPKGV